MIEAARDRLARFRHVPGPRWPTSTSCPSRTPSFDTVLVFHTLTYAEQPARALAECARVLRPGGRLVLLCLDDHRQHEVTARYGERHPGFSPAPCAACSRARAWRWSTAEVTCREAKKPHLQVVLAIADRPSTNPREGN